MSDNEQVRSHEVSSGDESSSEATKNGFSHDGEPVHRPRKVGGHFTGHFFNWRVWWYVGHFIIENFYLKSYSFVINIFFDNFIDLFEFLNHFMSYLFYYVNQSISSNFHLACIQFPDQLIIIVSNVQKIDVKI